VIRELDDGLFGDDPFDSCCILMKPKLQQSIAIVFTDRRCIYHMTCHCHHNEQYCAEYYKLLLLLMLLV
jgi:hypothetical protein